MTGAGDLALLVALGHEELARQLRAELGRRGFDDIGPGDRCVLRALHAAPLTVSALAGRLGGTVPAAGRTADDLCRRGYVERHPYPADAPECRLALTDRGRAALAAARRFHTRYERRLVRDHGADAVHLARAILTDMAGASGARSTSVPSG